MTGAAFSFEFDDGEIRVALDRLRLLAAEPAAMLQVMGIGLVRNVQQRFNDERDPQGNQWAPLLPAYEATKKGPGILREEGMSGGLQGSISAEVDGEVLAIGSNKIYAAKHQQGRACL